MVKILLITLIMAGCSVESVPVESGELKNFNLYQDLRFSGRPTDQEFELIGLKTMALDSHPFASYWEDGADIVVDDPSEEKTRSIAASHPSSIEQDIYFVDIEQLPSHKNDTKLDWAETLVKLSSILSWLKQERPNLAIGIYSIIPQREYWPKNWDQQWRDRNEYFNKLTVNLDFVAPSLYTFYDDPQGWVEYAVENIKEARKAGRPIYPFIWPQYHQSGALAGQLIDGVYWRMQLETIFKHADGVIIWGGWQVDWVGSISETDPNNWWFQTLDFMQQKGL